MKTRKLMAVLVMVAMIVTALPVVAFAEGKVEENLLKYSAAGSAVTVNKTKVDIPKSVNFTVRFREGSDNVASPVIFYVKSNRDAENLVKLDDVNYQENTFDENSTLENGVAITATPDNKGIVKFGVKSGVAGAAKISIYKPGKEQLSANGLDVDAALLIGEKTITWESSAKVDSVELDINQDAGDDGVVVVTAGNSFKLEATVYDDSGYWVEDQEVTFYEYYKAPSKNWGSRKNIGTAKTNEEGEAKLTVRRDDAGKYAYYARSAGKDSFTAKEKDVNNGWVIVDVEAANAYSVEAKDDVKYAELDEDVTVKFVYKDRYGSKVCFDIDDDDNEGLDTEKDVDILDPEGDDYDDEVDVKFNGKKELEVTFTPDEEGEYKVRVYIPGTGIYAETIVNTAEFGKVEKLGLKLYKGVPGDNDDMIWSKVDNAAVKMREDEDENVEYEVRVFEYDKNSVERKVDASEVYFSTSDAKIATVDRDGFVTLKKDATGIVTITATHEDGELAAELDITVSGDPVGVEVDVEVDDLKAKVKLEYFDKNGNLAIEGEEDEGYQVMAGDLEVTDVDDFDNGKAKFTLLAEEYGDYKVRVVTDEGLSVSFDVDFLAEDAKKVVEGAEKVTLFIGNDFANVDGAMEDLDAPAFIEDGRTYVPFRFLGEAFGAEVDWDPKEGLVETVTLLRDDVEVVIGIGDEFATVTADGEVEVVSFEGLGAAKIVDGRTYLPFRAVADIFGAEVDYGTDEDGFVTWVSFEQ